MAKTTIRERMNPQEFLKDLKSCMEAHGVFQICNMGDGALGFTTNSGEKFLFEGEDMAVTVEDIGRLLDTVA